MKGIDRDLTSHWAALDWTQAVLLYIDNSRPHQLEPRCLKCLKRLSKECLRLRAQFIERQIKHLIQIAVTSFMIAFMVKRKEGGRKSADDGQMWWEVSCWLYSKIHKHLPSSFALCSLTSSRLLRPWSYFSSFFPPHFFPCFNFTYRPRGSAQTDGLLVSQDALLVKLNVAMFPATD